MLPRFCRIVSGVMLFGLLLSLSACSISKEGTIPRGTPDTGNGTPAVLSTTTIQQQVPAAPVGTAGKTYAFVRQGQLWTALNGALPVQATHFDYSKLPNVFWHQPLWSPADHYLAVITVANPVGLGGGGCPAPDYSANGALYIMDTSTRQFTQVALPTPVAHSAMQGTPRMDFWQYMFWQDATHLLAWYNGIPGKANGTAGLYRYDVTTHVVTRVMTQDALGIGTFFSANQGQDIPLLLSMRYSNAQLFYQVVVHPFGQQSQLVIYRRSVARSDAMSTIVVKMGSAAWCAPTQSGSFVKPGWDISPDGEQLVSQMVNLNGTSAIQSLNLNDGSTTSLFDQVASSFLGRDVTLTWGPDSQTVVATAALAAAQDGPYSATLANPTALQQYAPNIAGVVAWRTDSTAFALQTVPDITTAEQPMVYVFLKGDNQGRTLLTDAQNFTWG